MTGDARGLHREGEHESIGEARGQGMDERSVHGLIVLWCDTVNVVRSMQDNILLTPEGRII